MRLCARNDCQRGTPWFGRQTGVTVDGRWYCSVACLEKAARSRLLDARPVSGGLPTAGHLRLGVWLRKHGVTAAQIEQALVEQRKTRLRLGAQLITLGHATPDMVLEALARQAGTDFMTSVDVSVVRHAPAGLSPSAVRALSLVPVTRPENGRVRVACAAPVPRVALAAFSRITGLAPEPLLVTDDAFEALLAQYGADAAQEDTAEFVEAENLGDAIRHITAAAVHEGSTRVTETRLAPLTWVRIQGDAGTRDVILREPQPAPTEA